MNFSDLQKNLKKGENEFVEFKATFNHEALVSLCAFANTKGGAVYLGISDEGKILGITPKQEDLQNWINELKGKTYPSLIPDVEVLEKDGKKVVLFSVSEFPIKPVSLQGRYYKRIKNSNHQMSPSEISEVHLRAMNGSFDYYFDDRHDLSDIDLGKVERLIALLNQRGLFFSFS